MDEGAVRVVAAARVRQRAARGDQLVVGHTGDAEVESARGLVQAAPAARPVAADQGDGPIRVAAREGVDAHEEPWIHEPDAGSDLLATLRLLSLGGPALGFRRRQHARVGRPPGSGQHGELPPRLCARLAGTGDQRDPLAFQAAPIDLHRRAEAGLGSRLARLLPRARLLAPLASAHADRDRLLPRLAFVGFAGGALLGLLGLLGRLAAAGPGAAGGRLFRCWPLCARLLQVRRALLPLLLLRLRRGGLRPLLLRLRLPL